MKPREEIEIFRLETPADTSCFSSDVHCVPDRCDKRFQIRALNGAMSVLDVQQKSDKNRDGGGGPEMGPLTSYRCRHPDS